MSKHVKISDKKRLSALLKLLAEESVSKAREDLLGSAESERMFQTDLASDLQRLRKSGKKQDPDVHEEDDEDLFADEPKKKKKKADPKQDKQPDPEDAAPTEEPQGSSGGEHVTFTMIKDRVNTIRSGRSLRDKEIREELKSYFKGLSDEEQIALHAFLDGIAQVLTAGIEGSEAEEPSEPPHNVSMTSNDGGSRDSSFKKKGKKSKKASRKAPLGKKSGLEDTSPPIDVGRKQRTESVRKRLRELMG